MIELQFRVIYEETLGGDWYPFSGKVSTVFSEAEQELEIRSHDLKYRHALIQCRAWTDKSWPHPYDDLWR